LPTDPPSYSLQTKFAFSGEGSEDLDFGETDRLLFEWKVTLNNEPISASECKAKVCSFTAGQPGDYRVSLKVKDPSDAVSVAESEVLKVNPDSPPCIDTRSSSRSILPFSLNPTMFADRDNSFEIISVVDDVNPYPADRSNSVPGSFKWSRKGTSGDFLQMPREQSNRYTIYANEFRALDQVQVRVEYLDGRNRRASCAPDITCCSDDRECCENNTGCECAQWITWTVNFR
jgi:hypothetical protein